MSTPSVVWVTKDIAHDLGINGSQFPTRINPINKLTYELLKEGQPKDIAVLPYIRNFSEILEHIRGRGITGPVIIYTNGDVMPMNFTDLASQGILFMDSSRFTKPMVLGFITFLQKSHAFISKPRDSTEYDKACSISTQDKNQIREFFQELMKNRTKIHLTCQFTDKLPTLTAMCEIIQIVGNIETKLVFDNFVPAEFVSLYNRVSRIKTLSGSIPLDGKNLGFDLEILHSVRGRITTMLPDSIYDQKRQFFRVEPDPKEPIFLHILPPDSQTLTFSVQDISEAGVGLITTHSGLEKDIEYPIALDLLQNKIILGKAHVVFKEPANLTLFNYGISLHLHRAHEQHLRQYVFKRQAGILATIRDLSL